MRLLYSTLALYYAWRAGRLSLLSLAYRDESDRLATRADALMAKSRAFR